MRREVESHTTTTPHIHAEMPHSPDLLPLLSCRDVHNVECRVTLTKSSEHHSAMSDLAPTPTTASTIAPDSHLKRYRPYLQPAEVERLSAKQRGKLSVSRAERAHQQACALIDAVGVRCGL